MISSTRVLAALQQAEGRTSVPVVCPISAAIICRSSAAFLALLALLANREPQDDGHVEHVLTLRPLWDGRPHVSGTVHLSSLLHRNQFYPKEQIPLALLQPVGVLQFLAMIIPLAGELEHLANHSLVVV